MNKPSISSIQFIPNSLLECFDNELNFDLDLFLLYRRHERQEAADKWWRQLEECLEMAEENLTCFLLRSQGFGQ